MIAMVSEITQMRLMYEILQNIPPATRDEVFELDSTKAT